MNILFLPINIASIQDTTANAFSKREGINVRSFSKNSNKYVTSKLTELLPNRFITRSSPIKYLYAHWKYACIIKRQLKWADAVHYLWGPAYDDGRDLKWVKKMKKPVFVEWVGSDIRSPEILDSINPYYKKVFNNGYEYKKLEISDNKVKVQEIFASIGAIPLLCPEMSLFLNKKLFPHYISLLQRININEFLPNYPMVENKKPLVIHSPSAIIAKGSNIIEDAINQLKENYLFEYIILHDMPREDVLNMISKADVFIDQVILGNYGIASLEAMSLGKPVMCYIMPEVFAAGLPDECPIVNTNPDNIREQLIKLIINPALRNEIGKKSRMFVEKYHDVDIVSKQLLKIYTNELSKAKEEK